MDLKNSDHYVGMLTTHRAIFSTVKLSMTAMTVQTLTKTTTITTYKNTLRD